MNKWNMSDKLAFTAKLSDGNGGHNYITWVVTYGDVNHPGNQELLSDLGIPIGLAKNKYFLIVQKHDQNITFDDFDEEAIKNIGQYEIGDMDEDAFEDFVIEPPESMPTVFFILNNRKELNRHVTFCKYFISMNPHLPEQTLPNPDDTEVVLQHSMGVWLLKQINHLN